MKKLIFIIISVLWVNVSFGQFDRSKVPSTFSVSDLEKINPEDIPDAEKLKEMGFSDEEISQALAYKELKLKEQKSNGQKQNGNGDNKTKLKPTEKAQTVPDSLKKKVTAKNKEQILPPVNVYGQEFFRDGNLKFYDKSESAKVPDNYVLAPGDEISISVWGYSDYNETFTISADGSIQPREAGRIYLKGLKFSDAKAILTKRFGQFIDLSNSKMEVTVVYTRVITVNIVGEVINPGSYTIPGVNTAFNALIAANGPSPIGSVRKIFIRRGGKTIKTLDIYQFLLNPDSDQDFFLENNDYIFVPPVTKVVTISGETNKPNNYELLEKENLLSLIKFSGGLSSKAYKKSLQIKRFKNNELILADVNLDSLLANKKDFEMFDGDVVSIRSIPDIVENYVEIIGAVKLPGKYAFKQGEKISDLVNKAQGFLDDAALKRSYILRQKENLSKEYISINLLEILNDKNGSGNLELKKYDIIEVISKKLFVDKDSISIFGAVRRPGKYAYGDGMSVKDVLVIAGGLTREAANNRIEISRVVQGTVAESKDGSGGNRTIVSTAEVGTDLGLDKKTSDFSLQAFDQIFVRQLPEFGMQENVVLKGEVVYPGTYSLLGKNERLHDIIARAGGLTKWAFSEGATLYRPADSTGYLFINLKKALDNANSGYNYILREGDTITIPKVDDLVRIKGAINYPDIESIGQINTPYSKGRRAGYYVRTYGLGFADFARRSKTYVVEANGFVHKTTSFGLFKIYPKVKIGSTIYAINKPNKIVKENKQSEPINWNKAIENTTIKITGILTLWLIFTQLNKN